MKRSLISIAPMGLVPAAVLCLVLQSTACNTKSPSLQIAAKEGAETDGADYESGGSGDSKENTIPSVPKTTQPSTDPVPVEGENESVSIPTPITGSPVQENKKSNGDQVIPNGRYFIKNAFSKKCLALPADSRDSGIQFVQRTCDRANGSMKFDVYVTTSGYFLVYNFGTGKFMEIRDQMPVMQAAVQQNDRSFIPNKFHQEFIIRERNDGNYNLKTRSGGMYVDLAGASTAEGALIQLWNIAESMSSAWIFEPAP